MVGGGINDWNFFIFMGVTDGWIFFLLRFSFSFLFSFCGRRWC